MVGTREAGWSGVVEKALLGEVWWEGAVGSNDGTSEVGVMGKSWRSLLLERSRDGH